MQVKLEPVGPSGRGARLGRRLAVVAPVVLVVGVAVVAATFRPPMAPETGDSAERSAAESAGHRSNPAATSAPAGLRTLPASPSSPPAAAWDLPVRSVAGLLDDRAAGRVTTGLVAVAGLLAYDPRGAQCPNVDPGLATVFCHRPAALAPAPDPFEGGTNVYGDPGPGPGRPPDGTASLRLHGRIPAGIPMPSMFAADPPPGAPGQPLLSVIIGRFTSVEPPACPDRSTCRDELVLERLAWAAGSWIDRILVRDPTLPEAAVPSTGRRPLAIASREADRIEAILSMAIVQPSWLVAFDRAIGDAAAAGASAYSLRSGPVWYVRSAGHPTPARERQLTWAVIDHQTGLLLASGSVGGV